MRWTPADIPNLSGRFAVVTGANGGLGLETARELARAGAQVVMAARNQEKAESARQHIGEEVPQARLEVVPLDLGSLASVREAAATIGAAHPRIDILVNNAGVMAVPEGRTADGFEIQLGTNHLGHFALTALLMPSLTRADAARVVSVTSTARHIGRPVDPANPHLIDRYTPWGAYGQSKLANLYFALELHRRLQKAGSPVSSLVAHPGLSNTDLQATSVRESGGLSQRFFENLARFTGMSPANGARPSLRAATDPKARSGQLYAPRFVNNGSAVRRPLMGRSLNRRAAEQLWEVSERETGIVFDAAATAPRSDD
ncbi:SDR family NAD(P)-dependent oxidoreductase [Mycobacterium paragordonae]|nr:SDR family NAD(P)-dependent oxidoreductase [Mycobacterium paragordonae]VAZ69670.1 Fatty acyl-CoA reductase [Mycobacterium kansasii]